jgi:hypothetical protein
VRRTPKLNNLRGSYQHAERPNKAPANTTDTYLPNAMSNSLCRTNLPLLLEAISMPSIIAPALAE